MWGTLSPNALWSNVVGSVNAWLPAQYQKGPGAPAGVESRKVDETRGTEAPDAVPASQVLSLRRVDELSLDRWIRMEAKEPLIVSGHTGTGKMSLIRQVLSETGIHRVIHIDVKAMLEKKDDMMVTNLSS